MKTAYFLSFLFGLNNWQLDQTPDELLQAAEKIGGGRALDIGCGEGDHSISLAKMGWSVIGIDFINRAIRQAKEKAKQAQVVQFMALYKQVL